jgi:catechol 2,3-dioxygenase-like lactoylglutathione lyase family enzyme
MWKLPTPLAALAPVAFGFVAPCLAQAPLVKGAGNFIHAVGNLDQSVHFYKDLIGMESPRPPGDWQTTEGIAKMYAAGGAKFRVGNAQVTGVAMRVEMVEFQNPDRRPVQRALGEPGASLLILTAVDLQPVLDRLKAANWPLAVETTPGCDGRGFAVADPDGFPVLVLQRTAGPTSGDKNIVGLRFGYTVSGDAVLKGPFKALGLTGGPRLQRCGTAEEAILKDSALSVVTLPDGFEITLAHAQAGKKIAGTLRQMDPGAAVLRFPVTDIEAAVRVLGQARVKVVSEGGVIQTLPPTGLKAAILGAPDNLFIQVVQ